MLHFIIDGMKRVAKLPLFASIPFLLCSCGFKSIPQEEWIAHFQKMEASLKEGKGVYTDVKISESGIFGQTYNYKEGEFYVYHYVAIALIIPINIQDFTWKENGKFYHCEIRISDKLTFKKEISEASFDAYMASHKATIISKLSEPVEEAKSFLEGDNERYTSISNEYLQKDSAYRLSTSAVYESNDQSVKESILFDFNDEAPLSHESKVDKSSKTWTYTYGQAKFTAPEDSRLQ